MRVIPLWQADGRLHSDAIGEVLVRSYFPNDGDSREQAMMLWRAERARAAELGERFQFSALARSVANSQVPRVARMTLAGYVALVLMFMGEHGHPMHLKRAARIVSDFVYRDGNDQVRFRPLVAAASVIKSKKASGDPDDIEGYFRFYRSAAHILAANVAASEFADPEHRHGFDYAPEYDACFIRTAMDFELRLQAAPNFSAWNLWSVASGAPASFWECPMLMPSLHAIWFILGDAHGAAIMRAEPPNDS